jgi:hypothetical protein
MADPAPTAKPAMTSGGAEKTLGKRISRAAVNQGGDGCDGMEEGDDALGMKLALS